jgi:hypothetical protein
VNLPIRISKKRYGDGRVKPVIRVPLVVWIFKTE